MSHPVITPGPVLSGPGAIAITTTTATAQVTSDTAGGTLFAIASTNTTQPSSAQIQAGTDASGAAAIAASVTPVAGVNSLPLTGMIAGTTYTEWFVQPSINGDSNIIGANFTTASPPPPPPPPPAPAPAPVRPLYLPFDPTALSPTNTVAFEYHTAQIGQNAIVKADYGPFYKAGFSISAETLHNVLVPMTPGVDFDFAEFDADLTATTGKAVFKGILIINPNLSGIYAINYQAVGGSQNVDTAHAWSESQSPLVDTTALDFNDIQELPAQYPPKTHLHDIKDVFGAEYLQNFMVQLKAIIAAKYTKFGTSNASPKDAELFTAVTQFKTTIDTANVTLANSIASHIATTGFRHAYTKAMVGLGNVVNGGFVPITGTDGNPLPVYANPAAVGFALAHIPAPSNNGPAHIARRDNPHEDTAASAGLGNMINAGVLTTYTFGQLQYQTVFNQGGPTSYISPFVAESAVIEANAANVTTTLTNPLNAVTRTGGLLDQATAQNTLANAAITAANGALTATNTAITNTEAAIAEAVAANTKFELVYYNAPYASLLSALLLTDYAAAGNGSNVGAGGYYPIPPLLDNLYLWFDVNSPKNTYQTDANGNVKLMALVDLSKNARLFVANNLAAAPTYTASADIAQGQAGISVDKVALFGPGIHMDQISGPPVSLAPGMTVFLLVRPLASNTPFTVLADTSAIPVAEVVVQPSPGVAIELATTTAWSPLKAAPGTLDAQTSTIIVASVHVEDEAHGWVATTKPLPGGYPRGTDTPDSTWPEAFYQSAPMTRIGNANTQSLDGGELVSMIIFNRQVSFAEAQPVIDYLRLAKTHNLALMVDTSAQNAF